VLSSPIVAHLRDKFKTLILLSRRVICHRKIIAMCLQDSSADIPRNQVHHRQIKDTTTEVTIRTHIPHKANSVSHEINVLHQEAAPGVLKVDLPYFLSA